MKTICIIILHIFGPLFLMAQESIISLGDVYTLSVPTIDISNYRSMDSTIMSITYRFDYQVDNDAPRKSTWMILDIGKFYTKFYSDDYYRRDSMYSYKFKDIMPSYSCERIPCEELLCNLNSGLSTVFNRIPNGPAALTTYEEKSSEIKWVVSEDITKTILGHLCYAAQGTFGGRKWTVLFAPDIPISYGPWKLQGLPGLILHAEEESGCYQFESIRISNHPKNIKWYECKYQKIKKRKWRKFDEKMHLTPLEQISNGGKIWYYYKKKRLDDTWSIPYNPIERE